MATLLLGIPGVVVFIDDILIAAKDIETHTSAVKQVLTRLRDAGLRLKFEKCQFFQREVKYLGYRINEGGLHPLEEKIKSVANAPIPQDITQLRSFLGGVNYYGRFMSNLAHKLRPLYDCLETDNFEWTEECTQAFKNIKKSCCQIKT